MALMYHVGSGEHLRPEFNVLEDTFCSNYYYLQLKHKFGRKATWEGEGGDRPLALL